MSSFNYTLNNARKKIMAGGQIVAVMVPDDSL